MQTTFRKKWRYVFGGAFALLFLILLAFRLGAFKDNTIVKGGLASSSETIAARDEWLTISQEERKVGYAHRRFFPLGKGYRLQEEVFLRLNTMGVSQALGFRTEGDFDNHMALISFNFGLDSGLFRFKARGAVKDKLLILHAGSPGEEKKMEIVLKEPLYLSEGILQASRFAGLRPGESRTFHVFDPVAMGERPVKVTMHEGMETMLHEGRSQPARKFSLDFMGATQFAWLGEDGSILKEKGILGITLEKTTREEALTGIGRGEPADLTELASLPANRTIDDPLAIRSLQVRLGNLDKTAFFLGGDRQILEGDVLRIHKETLPVASDLGKIGKGSTSPYLKPGPLIQSDHPLIVSKAREIVSGSTTDREKAEKLVAWVHKHIRKQPVLSVPDALETLVNRTGDCNEHAVLLAALARAADVPAEVEAGLVYMRGRFYYHAWNVLYIGGWVTADAVLGQMPADVTHIRFIRGAMERQMDLLGLMGRLRLEILTAS